MTCNRIQAQLDALLDGELDSPVATALEEHAANCGDCGRALERSRAIRAALRALPIPPPRAELFAQALRRAQEPRDAAAGTRKTHMLAALGGALAAGIVAVALTVFWQPPGERGSELSIVSMSVSDSRTVNLVFAAASALDDVTLTVELPPGIEVQGYAGRREIGFRTRLAAGNNVLPLPLLAVGEGGGSLVAHLRHGDERKTFVVTIEVS